MAYTIKGQAAFSMNATERDFQTLRVTNAVLDFRSMAFDVLRFSQAIDDATGAGPIRAEEDQTVELFQDGERRFKGVVHKVRTGGGVVTTEVRGPWWWMEKIDLTGNFTDDAGGTEERTNYVFPTQGLKASAEDLIDRFIALGVPMARGSVSSMYNVMKQSFPNMSCAAALAQLLLWCPDAVVWFDYSGTTPEINITRRENATRLTYTVGTHNLIKNDLDIHPRSDQRVQRVVLNYVDRHPTTGKKRYQKQGHGAGTTGRIQMVTISGPETVAFLPKEDYESYDIKTSSAAIDSAYVEKTDSQLSAIRKQFGVFGGVGTTVTTYSGSGTKRADNYTFAGRLYRRNNGSFLTNLTGKYLVTTPSPPQWVLDQYGGIPVTITGTWIAQWLDSFRGMSTAWSKSFSAMRVGAITGSGFENAETVGENAKYKNDWLARPFTVNGFLIDTNFPTKTTVYKPWDTDFIEPPAGLAENLRDAQNWTPYEGSVKLVADEWPLTNRLDRKLCIGGSLPEHATMDALLKSVSYDLMSGRMTLMPGPPPRADFGGLINRIRREPSDNIEYL